MGAEVAAPRIFDDKGQNHQNEHGRTGKPARFKKEMEHLGIGDHVVG